VHPPGQDEGVSLTATPGSSLDGCSRAGAREEPAAREELAAPATPHRRARDETVVDVQVTGGSCTCWSYLSVVFALASRYVRCIRRSCAIIESRSVHFRLLLTAVQYSAVQ
jgi:hypothetical protein